MAKNKYIESPEKLWELWQEYVNQLETIQVPVSHVKLGTVDLHIIAPMTMQGFCTYGYDQGLTIHHYVDNPDGAYDNYRGIISRIKDKIYSNNFNRAAVGLYKESLISKQLGLKEQSETTIKGEQPLFPDKAMD